jgi:diguanylate cyclase (GGDEF)-like protein/PAS domain S-box-containing protein
LLARGNLRTCSLAISLIVLAETTVIATLGAGIHDLALIVYPLILVMASLLDRRHFIVIFVLVILAVSWLVLGAANNLFTPTVYPSVIWTDLLVIVTILSGAALAVNSMSRNIWEGLSQARIEIAERKRVENALRESEEKYRRDFNNVSDVIYSYDLDLKIINISPSVEKILGYTPSEIIGKKFPELNILAPEYLDVGFSDTLKVFSGETIRSAYEFIAKDGTRIYGEIFGSPSLSKDGQIIGVVSIARDITERKRAEEELKRAHEDLQAHVTEIEKLQAELREQALRDPLTGLYNRRYLAEMLEHELARVKREKKPMSVIVTDIDHFKKINDNYGHQVGDEFLRKIANLISSHTRSSDIACRYGGEEFLLVMPGTSVKSAVKRAEELRLECAQIQIPYENKKLSVTLSFGVASYPAHGQGAEEIVIKADKALYKSKRSGRNRVTLWNTAKGRKPR